ncbi:MAG TPA: class I SAM-dependent methyltransferase [Candidatus Sulfopaludibacter sp.]|nr:class I SAM-dependent methyltransferase [Candidatus Sulfopaludibacter sp.]
MDRFLIVGDHEVMQPDATTRFTPRVADYRQYRPGYPRAILALLERECGLAARASVADVGCGTGLLARLFLDYGCAVWGVEPNAGMRAAAEELFAAEDRFHSVNGRAESTTLPDAGFDFVTAGQAFHWFDAAAAGLEFQRILKPAGWLVLVWNERHRSPGFMADYEEVIRDYAPEKTRIDESAIDRVFGGRRWSLAQFANHQRLDLAGLAGRVASSSYAPLPGAPGYRPLADELERLFEKHQEGGSVTLAYDTKVYWGSPGGANP